MEGGAKQDAGEGVRGFWGLISVARAWALCKPPRTLAHPGTISRQVEWGNVAVGPLADRPLRLQLHGPEAGVEIGEEEVPLVRLRPEGAGCLLPINTSQIGYSGFIRRIISMQASVRI